MNGYDNLAECCRRLAASNVPGWWLDENGKESNHWSATLDVMREELGRDLTDEEITCLSLSRAYGPTPCVYDQDLPALWSHLWPSGNPRGLRYDWAQLCQELRALGFTLFTPPGVAPMRTFIMSWKQLCEFSHMCCNSQEDSEWDQVTQRDPPWVLLSDSCFGAKRSVIRLSDGEDLSPRRFSCGCLPHDFGGWYLHESPRQDNPIGYRWESISGSVAMAKPEWDEYGVLSIVLVIMPSESRPWCWYSRVAEHVLRIRTLDEAYAGDEPGTFSVNPPTRT